MSALNLEHAGIKSYKKIHRNLSYEELYQHEMDPALEGLAKCYDTSLGAVTIDTGKFTGRSPKDKYIVMDDTSRDNIWWKTDPGHRSDNKPITPEVWDKLYGLVTAELNDKTLYVYDGHAGANKNTRMNVRVITEIAWQSHFCKNMFIEPTKEALDGFAPDWTVLNACEITCDDYQDLGLNSEVFIAFNLTKRMTIIGGTWYGGEMKKGIFSIMNYFLPLKGIGALHCSANAGKNGDTCLFFGLSGTGKTTLSTDPHRALIGDDEHGWDDDGIFNFEGGCYAKCISLSEENEPDIYHAIKRNALLENVVFDDAGVVDFNDNSKTENTRVSYPIDHIENIVKPISNGTHPKQVIFLTCDAFGVLPPVARLTPDQAMYQYLLGYTAKVAGTERGVTEPSASFSACFGAAFLSVHPTIYAEILGKRMEENGSKAYLVNTGWIGGAYGVGNRMSLPETRHIVDAILDGSIENAEFETMPIFNLEIPTFLHDVRTEVLNPRTFWADTEAYDVTAKKLAGMFIENFEKFTDTEHGKELVQAGPQLS